MNSIVLYKRKYIVVWTPSNSNFSTRTYYQHLERIDNVGEGNWKKFWKIKVPPKIHIFLWKIEKGIMYVSKFIKDRLKMDFDPVCKMCLRQEESLDHIFWRCSKILKFWEEFSHWWCLDSRQKSALMSNLWAARTFFIVLNLISSGILF